jgi:hypothetical protein
MMSFMSLWLTELEVLECTVVIFVYYSRVIAQTVSRQLPTAAARVRARVRSCMICGGEGGPGAGFLRVLRFPCQFTFHRFL